MLIFSGRRLLYATDATIYRWTIPGVSAKPGLQRVGFVVELPARDVRGANLRAFAVRGSVATELSLPARANGLLAAASAG